MKKVLLVFSMVLMGTIGLLAQRTITGKVTDDKGEPVIGANVVVKGTSTGTATDYEGKYTLKVANDAKTLVFSYTGFNSQEIAIGSSNTVDAQLKENLELLNEVVVTAIGIQRTSREVGYSVSKLKNEDLTNAKVTNLANGLTGKVSGLQINTVNNSFNPQVRVVLRGNRSFLGNNQALLVVDGVPVSLNYLNSINPNDVENVTVLKGANAAALYGSEASNGVLIVNTKRGQKGANISYSNTTTFENISFFPKLQTRFGSGSGVDKYGYPVYDPIENQCYGPEFDGSLVEIGRALENGDIQKIPYSALPDEKRKFFNTGVSVQNDLSFSTGSDKSKFFVSLQNVLTNGVVPSDKLQRNAIRVSAQQTYGKFTAAFNVAYTRFDADQTNSQTYWRVINTPMQIPLTRYKNWKTDPFADVNGYFNDYYPNPYWEIDNQRGKWRNDDLFGSFEMGLQLAPWLNIMNRTGSNYSIYTRKNTSSAIFYSDWAAHNGRNISSQGNTNASVYDEATNNSRLNNDLLITADKKFGDFTAKLILGNSIRETYYKQLTSSGTLEIPTLFNIKNRLGEANLSEVNQKVRSYGVFGDLTLGYKNYLFLHATGRNDWSSLLSKENRSYFYPGVDLSFVFTEAIPMLKDNKMLSYGKIRGGVTKVGSISIGPYSLQNIFGVGSGFPYGSVAGYSVGNNLANSGIRPEFTTSKELGLELGFLDSRINLEVALYQMNTVDQTVPINISTATGYTTATVNAGEMESRGIDLDLRLTPLIKIGELNWDFNINYSYNKNTVLSLYEGLPELSIGNRTFAVVGEQFPIIKTTDFVRDPQGRVVVDANTGYPIKDPNLKSFGHTNPNHRVGLNTTLRWKGFSLGVVAEYRGGNIILNEIGNSLDFTGISWHTAENGRQRFVYPNSVYKVGDNYVANTNITTTNGGVDFFTQNYNSQLGNYVTKADFWKLREVSLNYELPASLMSKTGFIRSITVGLVGRNLLLFVPKSNFWTDPEFNEDNSNGVGRTTINQTPPTRLYGFNVKVQF